MSAADEQGVDQQAEERPDEKTQERPAPASAQNGSSRSSWARLIRMGRPRLTKANLLVTVLACLLGFAAMTQVQSYNERGLESMSQEQLINLLDTVSQRGTRLNSEINSLTVTRDELKNDKGSDEAVKAAQERLSALKILAGTAPAVGKGIEMTIDDPVGSTPPANILDAVQELRDSGAEAIQINDKRVVAATWFGQTQDGILVVDGTPMKSPYLIKAIGDPHTMSTAMAIPGGVVESLRQMDITTRIQEKDEVRVTALRPSSAPRYAQPDTSSN